MNLVFQHGQAFDSDSKGVAAEFVRVVIDKFKNTRVDHTGAAAFDPAGGFADPAALSLTEDATDIHFGAGFGKGKIGGTEPQFNVWGEQSLIEEGQYPF